MTDRKLLAFHGLKWNPFATEVPLEGLVEIPRLANFCARVERLVKDGGFALITGEPGTGKSAALRYLADRLAQSRDVVVGNLIRPQSKVPDFYRELGDLFAVPLQFHNRWAGFKDLRQRWQAHFESNLMRPVLLIDEAQSVRVDVLNELRVLSSSNFDSSNLLTVVLAGDLRLAEMFRTPDLLPLGSRMRIRLQLEYAPKEELLGILQSALAKAGNPRLLTPELARVLVDHATGNFRVLMSLAYDLLLAATEAQKTPVDEQLFFDHFKPGQNKRERKLQRTES